MIMSAVVAIGITLTSVLVFQVRINKVTREGHQGYYAAESGLELGLNQIKSKKSGTLAAAIDAIDSALLPVGADSEYESYFCIGGTCTGGSLLEASEPTPSASSVPTLIKENQSVFIELYNVDSSLVENIGANPALCVHADGMDVDGVGGPDSDSNEVLEVSWVAWDSDLRISRVQKIFVAESAFSNGTCVAAPGYNGFPVSLEQFYPAYLPNGGVFAGMRIRITPLAMAVTTDENVTGFGDVQNVRVSTTTPTEVTSQIQLKSVSNAAGQKQALVALFPWSLPLSGLFDFVIYSEKSIDKQLPITIAQDLRRYGTFPASNGAIPNTPTDPFSGTVCTTNGCTYYIRLIATNQNGWTTSGTVDTSGNGGPQTINALSASSCILRTPYTFSAGAHTITFTSKPTDLVSYELLTRPAFSTADENFCP